MQATSFVILALCLLSRTVEGKLLISGDSRRHVPCSGMQEPPYDKMVQLLDHIGHRVGTGILLTPRLVATACHVIDDAHGTAEELHDRFGSDALFPEFAPISSEGSIVVVPTACLDDDTNKPSAPRGFIASSDFIVGHRLEGGEVKDGDDANEFSCMGRHDYAYIVLATDVPFPNKQFAWLQPRVDQYLSHADTLLAVIGYPIDKPAGSVWIDDNTTAAAPLTPTTLQYPVNTCGGHSGSPVLHEIDKRADRSLYTRVPNRTALLVGIHTGNSESASSSQKARRRYRSCSRPESSESSEESSSPLSCQVGEAYNGGVRVNCKFVDYIVLECKARGITRPSVDTTYYRRWCGNDTTLLRPSNGQD